MSIDLAILGPITQVVWIDLILSADNAVVIALACRALPAAQRRLGMVLGIVAAISLRGSSPSGSSICWRCRC